MGNSTSFWPRREGEHRGRLGPAPLLTPGLILPPTRAVPSPWDCSAKDSAEVGHGESIPMFDGVTWAAQILLLAPSRRSGEPGGCQLFTFPLSTQLQQKIISSCIPPQPGREHKAWPRAKTRGGTESQGGVKAPRAGATRRRHHACAPSTPSGEGRGKKDKPRTGFLLPHRPKESLRPPAQTIARLLPDERAAFLPDLERPFGALSKRFRPACLRT